MSITLNNQKSAENGEMVPGHRDITLMIFVIYKSRKSAENSEMMPGHLEDHLQHLSLNRWFSLKKSRVCEANMSGGGTHL